MNRAKVVIDARMVGPKGHGIAMYVEDLAQGLLKLRAQGLLKYDILFLTNLLPTKNSPLNELPCLWVDIPFLHPKEFFLLPKILRKQNCSLYHSPSFSSLLRYPCPHVQTIHDLNHFHFGNFFKKLYYKLFVGASIRKAEKIFTVSEFSKQEIQQWIPQKDATIAPNAIHLFDLPSAREEATILRRFGLEPKSYFFTLSNAKEHKNLNFLKQSYQSYVAESKGKHAATLPLALSIDGKDANGIIHTGSLDSVEVAVLLKEAKAFFFPSLYEGFGRPPLEAALYGVPVFASNIPPHAEALKVLTPSEYVLLDPKDKNAWKNAFFSAHENRAVAPNPNAKEKILAVYNADNLAKIMDHAYCDALHIHKGT